jgi:hypothetical protein
MMSEVVPLSYAMRVPSGDQAGRSSLTPGVFVMFWGFWSPAGAVRS